MATRYKTCVSIGEDTPASMLNVLTDALKESDYAEARLDYLDSDDVLPLLDLLPKKLLQKRIICTVRSKSDGGRFAGTEHARRNLLLDVAEYNPYLLDVELDALKKRGRFADHLLSGDASILVSWHSLERMPSAAILYKKLRYMAEYSTWLKIACMARDVTESMRMLDLYGRLADLERDDDDDENPNRQSMRRYTRPKNTLISFAMGDVGRFTRLLCLHLGSPYTYVSLGDALAPGQFSLADTKKLGSILDAATRSRTTVRSR